MTCLLSPLEVRENALNDVLADYFASYIRQLEACKWELWQGLRASLGILDSSGASTQMGVYSTVFTV